MTEFTWETTVPEEWMTAPILEVSPLAEVKLPIGSALLHGLLLKDGANLFAITWPGGQRLARTCAATDWAIEERFTGDQPASDEDPRAVLWAEMVNEMAATNAEVRRVEQSSGGFRASVMAKEVMADPVLRARVLAIARETYPGLTDDQLQHVIADLADGSTDQDGGRR